MDTVPPELLRYFISFLPLTALIAARSVSTKWRTLALTASLHPARKSLLDVYLAAIVHPNFSSLIELLEPYAREFDREEYIANLKHRMPGGCVLPDVFELWILEWPCKAIYFWAWAGLAEEVVERHKYYNWWGENSLAKSDLEPTIDIIPVPKKDMATVGSGTCQGLMIYSFECPERVAWCQLWLVIDPNERINGREGGRLIWTVAPRIEYFPEDNYRCVFGAKKIIYDSEDIPFGPPPDTDFKVVDFLNSLDFTDYQVSWVAEGLYWGPNPRLHKYL